MSALYDARDFTPPATPAADPDSSVFQRPPWNRRWLWFVLSVVILVADYLCGPEALFPILFALPVLLAARNQARPAAIAIALFLTAARFRIYLIEDGRMLVAPEILNELIRGLVLVFLAILVSRVAQQKAQLAGPLKQLEGLLAICANGKSILDEEQHWTRLETEIVQHSQAEFTHGICRDCARKLYGRSAPNEAVF